MYYYIGAKDNIDKALVRQYAKIQTCKFDEPKITAEDMWKKLNMLAMGEKTQINVKGKIKKVS
jgi:hypothetical protein